MVRYISLQKEGEEEKMTESKLIIEIPLELSQDKTILKPKPFSSWDFSFCFDEAGLSSPALNDTQLNFQEKTK